MGLSGMLFLAVARCIFARYLRAIQSRLGRSLWGLLRGHETLSHSGFRIALWRLSATGVTFTEHRYKLQNYAMGISIGITCTMQTALESRTGKAGLMH